MNMSVYTAPEPFGGPQLLTMLQILLNSKINTHTNESFVYHAFIEAMRRSYASFVKFGKCLYCIWTHVFMHTHMYRNTHTQTEVHTHSFTKRNGMCCAKLSMPRPAYYQMSDLSVAVTLTHNFTRSVIHIRVATSVDGTKWRFLEVLCHLFTFQLTGKLSLYLQTHPILQNLHLTP